MLRNLEFEIKSIIYSRVWIIFRRVLRKVAWNDKIGSMEWNRIVSKIFFESFTFV